jgi:diacylglycerol kinase (ATP)
MIQIHPSMHPEGSVVFIVNPIAGTRQKDFILENIRHHLPKEIATEIIFTEYPGHAYDIATEKVRQGMTTIVAVGGDGTVNEVASALVKTPCTMGIIPAGSGNGLARHLGIPLQVPEALQLIMNHKVQNIDAGNVNGKYFFCTCGTGFDASVGKKFSRDSRRGMLSYVRATIHQYINYSPKSYILKTSHKKVRFKAFLVTFANSGQYGNNAYIAPNAVIDDGMLDLCILRPFPRTSTISIGLRLFFKNIDQSPYLEVMRVKKASLKRKGRKKITIHLDGEPMTIAGKLKIKVVHHALQVMVPLTKNRWRKLLS